MAKSLVVNYGLLKETDQNNIRGMLGIIKDASPEVQFKTLRPMILASYGEATKNIIQLEGEGGTGGIGAKIMALLGEATIQERFAAVMESIRNVDRELEAVATLDVSLFDDKLNGKWLTDENDKITHRRLDIPVEMLGATPELIAKSEGFLTDRYNQFVALLRENKIVAADKQPRGGKLAVKEGKLTWAVPPKKASTPRDPNAPKAERSAKGTSFELSYGEGEGAQLVATGLGSKPKIVNAAAKFLHSRPDLFTDQKGLTKRDETIGSVNFGRAYAGKLTTLGFHWTEAKPATPAPAPVEAPKA